MAVPALGSCARRLRDDRARTRLRRWAVDAAAAGQACLVVITVTRIGRDGSVLTRTVHTASRPDPGRWEALAGQAALGLRRPYRPEPGEPVYFIRAGEQETQAAERDLDWPLRQLVIAVLEEGDG